MPRVRVAQTQFTQGEFSPLMSARSDLTLVRGGASRLLNRRPLSQGGTATRPALEHIATLSATPAVLVPFVFRSDQRYVLALSAGRLDAWTAGGTACTPVTGCPWTGPMLAGLAWVVAGDTILILHESMAPQRVVRTGATTFSVGAMPVETPGFARLWERTVAAGSSAPEAALQGRRLAVIRDILAGTARAGSNTVAVAARRSATGGALI